MSKIKNVVVVTPVWNEPLAIIQKLRNEIRQVKEKLNDKGVALQHFFIDDAALFLPDEYPVIYRHTENKRLAQTLIDAYSAIPNLKVKPDLVIRMDSQEHNTAYILNIVDLFSETDCEMVILPVWYWEEDNRPSMNEIYKYLVIFYKGLTDMDEKTILGTFNQVFPMGFQAYRPEFLKKVLDKLLLAQKKYEKLFNEKMSWGLDLLAILIAVDLTDNWDLIFSGFMPPWKENRGHDKIMSQKDKAKKMLTVFKAISKNKT